MPRLLNVPALVLLSLTSAGVAAADESHFLPELRKRQLFDLAEHVCRVELARQDLTYQDRVRWTTELMRTYAERGLNAAPSEREPWTAREKVVAEQFLEQYRNEPRLLIVRAQQALSLLARGELARMEAEVGSQADARLEAARTEIRGAARLFQTLDSDLNDLIPVRRRGTQDPRELSIAELSALQHNIRLQLARAYRNQAQCYPSGSADQLASLNQAVEQLSRALRDLDPSDPLVDAVRLDLASCYRLLGEMQQASQVLQPLRSRSGESVSKTKAFAETVRLLLQTKRYSDAERILQQSGPASQRVPEMAFAGLELAVARWRTADEANDEAGRKRWQQRALSDVRRIEERFGPYWGGRANRLLVRSGEMGGGGSVEILKRTALDLYRRGQLDKALQAFDEAVLTAQEQDAADEAFKLAYRAGLLQQQRSRFPDASQRFRDLALKSEQHPLAANAHLMAIVNSAEATRQDGTLVREYESLLSEHLKHFPRSDTSNRVALWRGQADERRKEWKRAIDSYLLVAPDAEEVDEAVTGFVRCCDNWLNSLPVDADRKQAVASIFQHCSQIAAWPAEFNNVAARARATLLRTRLALSDFPEQAESAALQLTQLEQDPDLAEGLKSAARLLLAIVQALQPERGGASASLKLSEVPLAELVKLSGIMRQVTENATMEQATKVAPLEQQTVREILGRPESSGLSEAEQVRLKLQRAAAESRSDSGAALGRYRQLVQEYPRQAEVHEAYASALLASADLEDQSRAIQEWRRLAARAKPRSQLWFRAKLGVARALQQTGNAEAALKLIRYLRVTEDLGAAGLSPQFDALEKAIATGN